MSIGKTHAELSTEFLELHERMNKIRNLQRELSQPYKNPKQYFTTEMEIFLPHKPFGKATITFFREDTNRQSVSVRTYLVNTGNRLTLLNHILSMGDDIEAETFGVKHIEYNGYNGTVKITLAIGHNYDYFE